ncbi:MCE family protein [Mycobacterium sp. AMU20-3851]|uniref:MCE family protein n=1 Tax=Mycobacterium sp. AMU20-3851 TaxID=3122055 RepID=UPI003754CCD2
MTQTNGRVLAGLGTVVVIGLIVGLSVGLFRGSFTETVPLTVVSQRAGLVMNPDAKVKMRGVQVGTVSSIESRPDGMAVLHLAMDPAQLKRIPSNVQVDIASSTVFGAKFVQLQNPADPSGEPVRAGDVLQGDHVTVEINTVFQQLTQLLDSIDPLKVNETLGAMAAAFNGRGEQFGRTLTDFNNFLAKIEPSLDNMATLTQQMPPVLSAYADGAQDLVDSIDNATTLGNSIVEEQENLDAFLISAIGLADVGNEVLGGNRQALRDLTHILLPTSELLAKYHEGIGCGIGGLVPFSKSPPFDVPGIIISASLTLGMERYRYPNDLPKVAAKAQRSYCKEFGLPDVPPEYRVPAMVADTGANGYQYGNQGILLNSDGLKQMLFGPLGGPPRNSAQVGMPG